MRIKRFVNSVFSSNSYVIDNGENAIIIDIGDIEPIASYLVEENLQLSALLLTHTHYDHIYGIQYFLIKYPLIPIYTSHFGKEALKNPKWNFSRYHENELIVESDSIIELNDMDTLKIIPNYDIQVISTPGHDKSCICYKINSLLFTGDSYIPDVKVISSLPNSNKEQADLWYQRLQDMSKKHRIYPGHGEIQL